MKHPLTIFITVAVIVGAIIIAPFLAKDEAKTADENLGTRVCTVTTSKVFVGASATSSLLSAGSRQWAVIQQPVNATNTLSINIGGTASSSVSYNLASTTPENVQPESFALGFATDFPTSALVTGWTDTGSTTATVIECK